MFWHLIITPLVTFVNYLYGLLPPWSIMIGSGSADGTGDGGATDHSYLHYGLLFMRPLDKFIPIHDGLLPAVTIACAIFVGLLAFKLVKFLLSLIPTISAGG